MQRVKSLRDAGNSKKQGNIGLAAAIWWFESRGYGVYIPLTDSQDADLVVDIEGRLYRVQVKTTYHKTRYGVYVANLKVSGGNRSGTGKIKRFDPTKVDYIFVLTDSGDMYFIPSVAIEAHSSTCLGEKYILYKVVLED